ncbi:MAG: hypothetical protein BJG00_015170 [Limnothrix sp. CACIAM 69d]|nr:MAG: hypothetical protein BJG00_015170 [Limnothrix sp. CACIAM 69d]
MSSLRDSQRHISPPAPPFPPGSTAPPQPTTNPAPAALTGQLSTPLPHIARSRPERAPNYRQVR